MVAERTGVASEDLAGKPLASVFGPAEAKRYEEQNKVTLAEEKPLPNMYRYRPAPDPEAEAE